MKIVTRHILLFLITCVLTEHASAGQSGNGGDGFASEFVNTAKLSIEILKKIDTTSVKQFDLDKFTGAVVNTAVQSEESLFLKNQEVDAINYPKEKLIKMSRSRWRELRESTKTTARFNLVIHEYLGIMKIDDSQYKVSNVLIKLMSVSNFSTQEWWNPMNPTNYLNVNIVRDGWTCTKEGISFDTKLEDEEKTYQACDHFTTIVVRKTGSWGGDSSGLMGTFHKFQISVNRHGKEIGNLMYEPEWGKCLITTDSSCSQSGDLIIGELHNGGEVNLNFNYRQ